MKEGEEYRRSRNHGYIQGIVMIYNGVAAQAGVGTRAFIRQQTWLVVGKNRLREVGARAQKNARSRNQVTGGKAEGAV